MFRLGRRLIRQYSQYALRDYQRECISSCLEAFNDGKRRIGVSLATGGGKTVIFSHLVGEVIPVGGHGDKALIVVHREELVHQAYERIKQIQPDLSVDIEMAKHHASGMAHVTVASIQSITRPTRITKFNPLDYKLVIIDEAHHAAANQYLKLLRHFGATRPDSKVAVAGFSATLYRQDGKSLTKAMDELVFHRDLLDMIQSKWLCNVHITTVSTDVDLSQVEVSTSSGDGTSDFKEASLSKVLNTTQLNELVVRTWSHHSKMGKKYKSTIIFCADIAHSVAVADEFRRKGVDARVVTSNTTNQDRKNHVQEFREGKFPVMVNCGVFTEGTDIPNIDMVIVNRPTKSPGLLSQMIGRGLRVHEGKKHCHVIDLVGVVGDTDVATTPALFRLETDGELLANADVLKLVDEAKKQQKMQLKGDPRIDSVKFETFEDISDFLKNPHKLRPGGYSSLNWIPISEKCYILSGRGGYLRLEELPRLSKYSLTYYWEIPFKFPKIYRKQVVFDDITDPKDAVVAADKFVKQRQTTFPAYLIQKAGKWKNTNATDQQLTSLQKHFTKVKPELRHEVESRNLMSLEQIKKYKKGKASDTLSQFMHGGPTSVLKWMVKQDKKREQLKKVQQFGPPQLHVH